MEIAITLLIIGALMYTIMLLTGIIKLGTVKEESINTIDYSLDNKSVAVPPKAVKKEYTKEYVEKSLTGDSKGAISKANEVIETEQVEDSEEEKPQPEVELTSKPKRSRKKVEKV